VDADEIARLLDRGEAASIDAAAAIASGAASQAPSAEPVSNDDDIPSLRAAQPPVLPPGN
jgi:hypothetical protein